MGCVYVYRLDDITATMNWHNFNRLVALFEKYKVKPIIGIVPDNKDPQLMVEPANPDFHQVIRKLYDRGVVDVCQHGTHHVYHDGYKGLIRWLFERNDFSEFAGLSYKVQCEKIRLGKSLLEDQGYKVDCFMAPSHNMDRTTVRALVANGFKYVTDGFGIANRKRSGIVFVPQQIWHPKRIWKRGVVTICLHPDEMNAKDINRVEAHLSSSDTFVSFYEAAAIQPSLLDLVDSHLYVLKRILGRKVVAKVKRLRRRRNN